MQPNQHQPQSTFAFPTMMLTPVMATPGAPHMVAETGFPPLGIASSNVPVSMVHAVHATQNMPSSMSAPTARLISATPTQRSITGNAEWVGLLTTFGGSQHEDVDQWLKEFEAVAHSNHWNEDQEKQYFRLCLEDNVLQWCNSLPPHATDSWLLLSSAFKKEFTSELSHAQYWEVISKDAQQEGEDPRRFMYTLDQTFMQLSGGAVNAMPDEVKKSVLIMGLAFESRKDASKAKTKSMKK